MTSHLAGERPPGPELSGSAWDNRPGAGDDDCGGAERAESIKKIFPSDTDQDHEPRKYSLMAQAKERELEPQREDPAANTSRGSIGGAIAEKLAHFGQRIMGSFGCVTILAVRLPQGS